MLIYFLKQRCTEKSMKSFKAHYQSKKFKKKHFTRHLWSFTNKKTHHFTLTMPVTLIKTTGRCVIFQNEATMGIWINYDNCKGLVETWVFRIIKEEGDALFQVSLTSNFGPTLPKKNLWFCCCQAALITDHRKKKCLYKIKWE